MNQIQLSAFHYEPSIPWHKFDFLVNKHYWQFNSDEEACTRVRLNNLSDLSEVLKTLNVQHFLFGTTLKNAWLHNKLLPDHDDDVGMHNFNRQIVENRAIPALEAIGFKVIRSEKQMISVERDYRYIDLCFFSRKGSLIGYNNKYVPCKYLKTFTNIQICDLQLPVPFQAKQLVDYLYPASPFGILIKKTKLRLRKFARSIKTPKIIFYSIQSKYVRLLEREVLVFRAFFERLANIFKIEVVSLTENSFLGLNIEPVDSFNWQWRKMHLDIITAGGSYKTVGSIIDYLAKINALNYFNDKIIESDTSDQFTIPSNLDMRFWWSGNNYFWYCIKYQFKHSVVPYSKANKYIEKNIEPLLYSAHYYESLVSMKTEEINLFLNTHPIVVEDNSVVSGKHRVFAQLGRLLANKEYIPMKVIRIYK